MFNQIEVVAPHIVLGTMLGAHLVTFVVSVLCDAYRKIRHELKSCK
jgi:hypothetical protein